MPCIPVSLFLSAEECGESFHILIGGDHKQAVFMLKHSVGAGDCHTPLPPQTRYHEVKMRHPGRLTHRLAEQCRILHHKGCYKGLVVVIVATIRDIAGAHRKFAKQHKCQYDANHSQRIRHSATQCRPAGRYSQLRQGLLGCAKGRGIGRGAAQYTYHVRHRDIQHKGKPYGHESAEKHKHKSKTIKQHSPPAE